jgi:hypothetical protein
MMRTATTQHEEESMSDNTSNQPRLTVGSLLGIPLGSTVSVSGMAPSPAGPALGPDQVSLTRSLTTEERPWTIADGALGPVRENYPFRLDGVEALTYDNAFGQPIEQVWFDGKLVYALDLGSVDVDPGRVKVAQEYDIVSAVELDEHGRLKSEPERVPGQLNIYDSVPGMDKYSPIWQFNYVVVPSNYQPNTLQSESDCLASGYPIHRAQVFEN